MFDIRPQEMDILGSPILFHLFAVIFLALNILKYTLQNIRLLSFLPSAQQKHNGMLVRQRS